MIRSSGWFISLGSPVSNRRISGPSIRPSVRRKPDRELVLEARGPHRDRDRDRVLAGTRGPDLERLLADDAVAAELEVGAADGHDPGRRDVAGRRRRGLRHGVTLELVMTPAPS